jgi:lysine-specific histone demethylase 1
VSSLSKTSIPSRATTFPGYPPDLAVDLGAQIVTGFNNGNPLAPIIKRQLQLRWHHLLDDSILFNDVDGVRVDRAEDIRAEKLFNDILDRASAFKEKVKDQPLIEGDRELIDQGKEPHGESGRQIAKVEENEAILPPMPLSPPLSATRESSVSNYPSPRRAPHKNRIPTRRALTKMGFKLKEGEIKNRQTNPDFLSGHTTLGDTMKSILVNIQGIMDLSPMDMKLLNWHWANLEYGNATNLRNLSLKHWDQDDGNEYQHFMFVLIMGRFLGAHAMIVGGYGQFTSGLASTPTKLDIRHNHCVEKIIYPEIHSRRTPEIDEPPVEVVCDNGQIILADAVVVTASLGVLKSGSISFDPELPSEKRCAISRLGFGLLNKVFSSYVLLILGCSGL